MTGITVIEERWAPVSAGEYDCRTRLVSVNMTVVDEVHARFGHEPASVIAAIVAHERVHALSTRDVAPHEEEVRARVAATEVAGPELVSHIDDVLAGVWK